MGLIAVFSSPKAHLEADYTETNRNNNEQA